jgi:rhodanese-related sulfurtransferase
VTPVSIFIDDMHYRELTPDEALARLQSGQTVVLDVRTWPEWISGHIPGAVHIPLDDLTSRYRELDPDAETVVVCAHGIRSAAASQWLLQAGFERVANMRHGMSRWNGPVRTGSDA